MKQPVWTFCSRNIPTPPQTGGPLLEEIGNGMVRVMLSALDAWGYPPEQLGQDFIRSATSVQGNPESFLQSLSMLAEMTRKGQMPFSAQALDEYLAEYAVQGYPTVSHSEAYRNAYHPAYRVLLIDHIPDKIKKQV